MAGLLDTLRNNFSNQLATKPVVEDETARARRLLAAKSGRAAGGTTPTQSNLGEQAAVGAGQTEIQKLQPAVQMQKAGLAAGAEQAQTAQDQLTRESQQKKQAQDLQMHLQTNQILGDLERSGLEVDNARQRAQLEQVGQSIALGNKQYIQKLQAEGARARLDNQIQFQEMLQKSILGDNLDLLKQKLGQDNLAQATQRDWNQILGGMDLGFALQVAQNAATQANIQAKWEGAGQAVEGGVDMYKARSDYNKENPGTPEAPAAAEPAGSNPRQRIQLEK